MIWPTTSELAIQLRRINAGLKKPEVVRMSVNEDGWSLAPSVTPPCGVVTLPGRGKRFDSYRLAWDLIEQCKAAHFKGFSKP